MDVVTSLHCQQNKLPQIIIIIIIIIIIVVMLHDMELKTLSLVCQIRCEILIIFRIRLQHNPTFSCT